MARGDWQRVSRRRPCAICSKADWCLYVGRNDDPTAALCMRVESDRPARNGGWLHILRSDSPTWAPWKRTFHVAARQAAAEPTRKPALDIAKLTADCQEAIGKNAPVSELRRLADLAYPELGVSIDALRRLGIGWSKSHKAWTFPMCDARGDVTGIRLRLLTGRKLSVKGGKEGLFLPRDLQPGARLLIAEGPTDTAALLDLGFAAVGRPSCTGGTKHLVELVKRLGPSEVVIVADGDGPGQRGADRLAVALLAYVPIVRVVVPPPGVKDAREWKRAGATAADVHLAIQAATPKTLKIRVSSNHERASLVPGP